MTRNYRPSPAPAAAASAGRARPPPPPAPPPSGEGVTIELHLPLLPPGVIIRALPLWLSAGRARPPLPPAPRPAAAASPRSPPGRVAGGRGAAAGRRCHPQCRGHTSGGARPVRRGAGCTVGRRWLAGCARPVLHPSMHEAPLTPLLTLPPRITTSRCNPRRCSETLLPLPPPVPRCCFPAAAAALAGAGTATQCTATCRPCSMRGGGCGCCRRARTRSAVSENLSTCTRSRGGGVSGAERGAAAKASSHNSNGIGALFGHSLYRIMYRS